MEETRILMVVKEDEARAAYERALQDVGAAYDVADSFQQVLSMSMEHAYNGLLIDILTLVRSSKEEKAIAYDCINYYPSLRVKWDGRRKAINLSPLEQSFSADAETTLACFVEKRCRSFAARSLRRFSRKESYLSLLLSTHRDFPDEATTRSFTVNVSRGGAFVHTLQPMAKGTAVWLRFLELRDVEPIRGIVCWQIEWGTSRSIPGVGVMFESLSERQEEGLASLANLEGR